MNGLLAVARTRQRRGPGRPGTVAANALLFLVVVAAYERYVVPIYAYEGYTTRGVDLATLMPPLVLASLPALWLPLRPKRLSGIVLWVVQVLIVVPTCAVTPLIPIRPYWQSVAWCGWVVASHAAASWVLWTAPVRLPSGPFQAERVRRGTIAASAAVVLLCAAALGTPTAITSLSDVYVIRLRFREQLASVPGVFGYLVGWLNGLIAPLLIISGICRRSVVSLGVGFAALAWIYLMSGTRQSLIMLPFAAALYLAARRPMRSSVYPVAATAVIVAAIGGYLVTGNPLFIGGIVSRLFAVPGLLGQFYFDQFAEGPPMLFRDSFGSFLSRSPFDRQVTYLIGERYLDNPATNANANLYADAFANLWFAGIVIAVLFGFVLWILDGAAERSSRAAVAAALAPALLALANVGLTVTLLSTGMGLLIALIWLGGPAFFPDRAAAQPADAGRGVVRHKARASTAQISE